MPGFPQSARPDAARAAPRRGGSFDPAADRGPGPGRRDPRTTWARLLARGRRSNSTPPRQTIGRRCFTPRLRGVRTVEASGAGYRSYCWTSPPTRSPSRSSPPRALRAGPRRPGDRSRGDDQRSTAFAELAPTVEHVDGRRTGGQRPRASCGATFSPTDRPPVRARAGDVRLFSAPGEGREAVEIVRRVLDEARAACRSTRWRCSSARRSSISACSSTRARAAASRCISIAARAGPDPAGRAFVALLSCAVEGLSARRFDEYLSLGQVPQVVGRGRAGRRVVMPRRRGVCASRGGR